MVNTRLRIIDEKCIDDNTTSGQTVYVDEDNNYWFPTHMTKENCGTGDTVGELRNGYVYF